MRTSSPQSVVLDYETSTHRHGRDLDPLPVLDRQLLEQALEENGLNIKPSHLDLFYGFLHQYGYPPLPEFVSRHLAEQKCNGTQPAPAPAPAGTVAVASTNKRKEKARLPHRLLNFLAGNNDDEKKMCNETPQKRFATLTSRVTTEASTENTTKLAVTLQDGHVVECVLMFHSKRTTLCVSSQVGCAMACTFCATGTMGLLGDLYAGEILEQAVHANKFLRERNTSSERQITNVVYMGMGEPLHNYNSVKASVIALMDRRRWNLAYYKITVSTVGVLHNIQRLTKEMPQVNLALSLHAPTQELRQTIVPTAKRYPIEKLIKAIADHNAAGTGDRRKVMIEYVMLDGPTSTMEAAHQLGRLCGGMNLVVNLIPYNSTESDPTHTCPSKEHMARFRDIVVSYKVFCTIRKTMGSDITGACGQLVVQKEKKSKNAMTDMEDLVLSDKPKPTHSSILNTSKRKRKVVTIQEDLPKSSSSSSLFSLLSGGGTKIRRKQSMYSKWRQHVVRDGWVLALTMGTLISFVCTLTSTTLLLLKRP